MIKSSRQTENLFLTLSGDKANDLIALSARVKDRLSAVPEMRLEFYSTDVSFDPTDLLGTKLKIEAENGFIFSGVVISVEDLGHEDDFDLFAAEVRPWPWLLSIGSENRVYQDKSTVEIVKDVFQKAGFTDVTVKLNGTYNPREYCLQFGESNLDFVTRLLEEDGVYYFFDYSGATEKIVLADSISAHDDKGEVKFTRSNQVGAKQADSDSIFEWAEIGKVVTGKVSLFDYEMTTPGADLKVTQSQPSGSHAQKAMERYQARGHYKTAQKGEVQAKAEIEGYAAESARAQGVTNDAKVRTGGLFTLDHPDRAAVNAAYLVVGATHYMQFDAGYKETAADRMNRTVERLELPEKMALFETEFEVQKSSVQYRPKRQTSWPEVPGLLTGIVTGPKGEEIYTDEYGRIKVQFYWDRLGKGDDKSSCWVRSVMPWGGKGWGMLSVPRIGMEVVIQFERGNIDRPYCTGVVYNAVNKPPYALAGEMTKTGIRTNSTKGGGGFHELTFEDKKGSEEVFFQSEKDYRKVIKNNATVTIGMEKKDPGDLKQTIYHDKVENIETGDTTLEVKKGNRITKIKTDDTTTTEGKTTTTITGDTTLEIKTGNLSETIKTGNMTTEVSMGNQETTVKMGNITVDAKLGKIAITAMQEITLTVGQSSIKIDQMGVTVTGAMTITLDAKLMTEIKAVMTKVGGTAMVQVQGGIVMVN